MLTLVAGILWLPPISADQASEGGTEFKLSTKGQQVSLAEIKTICEYFGLLEL